MIIPDPFQEIVPLCEDTTTSLYTQYSSIK